MLRLKLSAGPEWLTLAPGIRFLVRPMSTTLMSEARQDPLLQAITEETSREEIALVMGKALGVAAIVEWEGILDDATGEVAPVSAETIAAVMECFPIFQKWQELYVQPGLVLESEGNVSGSLPSGTSGGAGNTAAPASGSAPSAPGK